jgi:hypothetical protein
MNGIIFVAGKQTANFERTMHAAASAVLKVPVLNGILEVVCTNRDGELHMQII